MQNTRYRQEALDLSCTAIFDPLYKLFGAILKFFYELTGNYGVAIILFTLAVNIILLPLTWKQQKSTTKMQAIQPELQRIQQKYKNDKEKLNMEMMKLYQDNDINPMGGCLPLLIQLPIIFILYQIVYRPLTYMIQMAPDAIEKLKAAHNLHDYSAEIKIAAMEKSIDIDFNFLGLDLSQTPNFNQFHWIWLIPVLAGLTTYALSWLTNRQAESRKTEEQKRKDAENPTANSMQTMTKIMPLLTVWFAFSFPAGIGFYWIMNNIFKMIQQIVVNKILSKEDPLVVEKNSGKKKKKK